MPVEQQWNRHTILAALRAKHMTLLGLVERYGISRGAISNIWSRPNGPAERAIADFLQEPVESLFSDRYPKNKNRILAPSYSNPKPKNKSLAA